MGHQVVIHVKPVEFAGKVVDGIRLAAQKGTPTFAEMSNQASDQLAANAGVAPSPSTPPPATVEFEDDLPF